MPALVAGIDVLNVPRKQGLGGSGQARP